MDANDLAHERDNMQAAISLTLHTLRHARDAHPEQWAALMATDAGPGICLAWDTLRPWYDADALPAEPDPDAEAEKARFSQHLRDILKT